MAEKVGHTHKGILGGADSYRRNHYITGTVGSTLRRSQMCLTFTFVKTLLIYNAIFSQPDLNALRVVLSTYYLLMRFPTLRRVGDVCGNQALTRQCYLVACQAKPPNAFSIEGLDTKDELTKERGKPIEDLVAILLHDGDPQHSLD